jgi:hypothetical protein
VLFLGWLVANAKPVEQYGPNQAFFILDVAASVLLSVTSQPKIERKLRP